MAIKILQTLFGQPANTIVKDLSYDIESRLVAKNLATFDLTNGIAQTIPLVNSDLSYFEKQFLIPKDQFDLSDSQYPQMGSSQTLGGENATKTRRIVSSLGGWRNQSPQLSNGTTQISGTDRVKFNLFSDCTNVSFLYVNGYSDSTALINPAGNGALNIRASLDQSPQCLQVPFSGSANTLISGGTLPAVAISDQGILHSQEMPVPLLASADQYIRTYKIVSAGQKWPGSYKVPAGSTTNDQLNGSTQKTGADATAVFSTPMATASSSSAMVFGPTAVIGVMNQPVPVAMVAGDSVADGAGATVSYIQKALADAGGWGIHTDAIAGCVMLNFNKYDLVCGYLAKYVDIVAFHMGVNDLSNSTFTTLAGYQTELKKALLKFSDAKSIWVATILPRTTSTDTFATVANQTPFAAETLRVTINNWLRNSAVVWAASQKLQVGGVIDNCVGYERSPNGSAMTLSNGQQIVGTGGRHPATGVANGYTADGIHPNDAGVAIIKTLEPVAAMRMSAGF